MGQQTYVARKGEDADFAALTCSSLVLGGSPVTTDTVTLADAGLITLGDGADITLTWNGTSLVLASAAAASPFLVGAAGKVVNATLTGTLTVGVNDTGYDVKLFGATAGCSTLWDESEDQLVITGPADVPAIKIAGAGSKSAAAYAAAGTAWADGGTPALCADQMYMILDVGGTLYRLPLWANA